MRVRIAFALFLAATAVTGCSGIFFFPQKQQVLTPDRLNLEYKDVVVRSSDDVRIHGWWLPARGAVRGTVYFLHGNAENISTHIRNVAWLPGEGYQVFLIDYRGFGLSSGTPNLPGALDDVRAGFRFLVDRTSAQNKPVYLLGQSLGASMGLYFAATDPQAKQVLDAVVSDAAFTGYGDIARAVAARSWLTWAIQLPVAWSMIRGYDPIDYVAKVAPVPLLLIHSRDDEVVPFTNGRKLFAAAAEPKTFYETRGRHTSTFQSERNREYLLKYLARRSVRSWRQDIAAPRSGR